MSLSDVIVSFDLHEILGGDFDTRRTKAYVTTNVANGTLMDTSTGETRLGDQTVTIAAAGTGTFTTWAPGADGNPTSWQTSLVVDYPRAGHRDRIRRTFGPYTITGTSKTVTNKALTSNVATITTSTAHGLDVGNTVTIAGVDATFNGTFVLTAVTATTVSYAKTATDVTSVAATGTLTSPNIKLTSLEEEQAVPAEYLTSVTTQLDTYVTAAQTAETNAEAAQAAAEAALAATVDISGIATPDDLVEDLVLNTGGAGPKTSAALLATTADAIKRGAPIFWDDFSGATDGDINGKVSASGHTWNGTGTSPLHVVSGKLQPDPADTAYSSGYAWPTLSTAEKAALLASGGFRMVGDFDLVGGNDSLWKGGGALVVSETDPAWVSPNDSSLLHLILGYCRSDLGVTPMYPTVGLSSLHAATYVKTVMCTLTSGSTAVTAVGGTFEDTEQPVMVMGTGINTTGTGVSGDCTLTKVDDTHATLSIAATASGTYPLQVTRPLATDGSKKYHAEMIADFAANLVTLHLPSGRTVAAEVKPRTDAATVTSGSPVVLDASITAGNVGKPVTGTGIPANTYVGTVTVGVSFRLTSSRSSQVDVNATANGTKVTIGQTLADYVTTSPRFVWESQRNADATAPKQRWSYVGLYALDRNAPSGESARVGRYLGRDVLANPGTSQQARLGQVATSAGLAAGIALGSAEDATFYRGGPRRISTDGTVQAAPATGFNVYTASTALDTDTDGMVYGNGASITLTLPSAAACARGKLYVIKNLHSTALTIATTGGQNIEGGVSVKVPQYATIILSGNANNAWWVVSYDVGRGPAQDLTGTPTPTAGANAGTSPPTPTMLAGSTDRRGVVYVGTGTGAAAGELVTIAFSRTLDTAPFAVKVWQASSSIPGTLASFGWSTTGFGIRCSNAASSQAVGTYRFGYELIF